ncbi:F-box protein [Cucumis melo var. makuwa]|uniref:F-box protein n=1 Tax=Cucumis melo var. makuwa TaxID=1194695 RepID=A0A5A7U9W6_CUCMM|nr:F-box protein [Cucumis melo var. makuwa]
MYLLFMLLKRRGGEFENVVIGAVMQRACGVCRKWKEGVKLSLGRRNSLSFAGWKMDDNSTARLIRHAYSLWELDM